MIEVNSENVWLPYATEIQYLGRSHYWFFVNESGKDNFNIHIELNQSFHNWNVPFSEYLRNIMFRLYKCIYIQYIAVPVKVNCKW